VTTDQICGISKISLRSHRGSCALKYELAGGFKKQLRTSGCNYPRTGQEST